MRISKSLLGLILLSMGIQFAAFYFIDPLSYPDTIRYFNLADFLKNPGVRHFGDLAYNNGILYTSLFLPVFLLCLNKIAGLSYMTSGVILEAVSFQAVIWLTYAIALIQIGKRPARFTLILTLTYLSFVFYSAQILTEYPFMAVLLFIIFYVLKKDAIGLKEARALSFLFFLLATIRTQAYLFLVVITAYLIHAKKMKFKRSFIILLPPLVYGVFYACLYIYLDRRFPSTLALNEIFSLNEYFLGKGACDYDFLLHGGAVGLGKGCGLFGVFIRQPWAYLNLLVSNFNDFLIFLCEEQGFYYIFAALLFASFFLARMANGVFLSALIIANFLASVLFFVPYYSYVRYQAPTFTLSMIFLGSYFASAYRDILNDQKTRQFVATIFCCMAVAYGSFFIMRHDAFFKKMRAEMIGRKEAIDAAALIRQAVGTGKKIAVSRAWQYGMIYRSSNTPLFFYSGWNKSEISDYLSAHRARYLICGNIEAHNLRKKGIGANVILILSDSLNRPKTDWLYFFEMQD